MEDIKLKDLQGNEVIAEDVYRHNNNASSASKEIPIVTKGTIVTPSLITRLIGIFGSNYKVKCGSEFSYKPKEELKACDALECEHHFATISKEEALEYYKNAFFEKEHYKITKERLYEAFKEIDVILQEFADKRNLNDNLLARASRHLSKLVRDNRGSIDPALVYLIELERWDKVTFNHGFDVAVLALTFGSAFTDDIDELTSLFLGGLIHDIGKYFYSKFNINEMDYIIKKEGKLSDDEYDQIKKHVDVEDFLREHFTDFDSRYRSNVIYGAVDHHENYDGSGYLRGKSGQSISYAGRLIAICDVYDAMIRERRYKSAMKPNAVMKLLKEWSEKGKFDPILFKRFYKVFGKYPKGSVINTSRGVGVVVEQTADENRPVIFFPEIGEINLFKHKEIKIIEDEDEAVVI